MRRKVCEQGGIGMLRVMAWNIRHGGGGARMPMITLAVIEHRPDVVVLIEFRSGVGGQIRSVLADHGLTHQVVSPNPAGTNGVLIASRGELRTGGLTIEGMPGRVLEARHAPSGTWLIGVHAPDDTLRDRQRLYWHELLAHARGRREERVVIIGDFNAGRRGIDCESGKFRAERSIGGLASLGYEDAWRRAQGDRREYTWFSHRGNGFRLDGAFLSASLAGSLQTAVYSQVERSEGVSDHAVFRMDLDLLAAAPETASGRGSVGLFGGA